MNKGLGFVSLAAVVNMLSAGSMGFGQSADRPTFEVASVKPAALDTAKLASLAAAGQKPRMGRIISGTRVEYIYMSMRELIAEAYHVKYDRIVGADWLNSLRFDIVAKVPEGAGNEDSRIMLQTLLEERFKLALHHETREQPVMALTVGKNGPKLKEFVPEKQPIAPDAPENKASYKMNPATNSMHYEVSAMTMAELADTLTAFSRMGGGDGRTVVDMTGLKGRYGIALDIPLATLRNMAQATRSDLPSTTHPEDGTGGTTEAPDPDGPSILESLQTLGLKLDRQKAPLEQLVIDRVEKSPIAN
jgi:uncharacterized protein (TIGR03435 family)